MTENRPFDAGYWSGRYSSGATGWDIGYPATPLVEYFSQLNDKSLKILIPGCGNAYEAEWLHQNGFGRVTLLDISPAPLQGFAFKNPGFDTRYLLCEDFFKHEGIYDLIVEQTFLCALHPSQRTEYVSRMHRLLPPGGRLVGVLFNRWFDKPGPPFGGNIEEYHALFSPHFEIEAMEDCKNSIPPRAGTELFIRLKRRS